ncbi:Nudix hydrolase 5 [Diplonema papillatum]|nr:Nudix hydrolase 5 [Diplonema papillatum]
MAAMFSAERVKKDRYNGVQLKLRKEECTATPTADFERALDDFLQTCRARGVRGVWLQVPIQGAKYVECTVRRKFVYHHARPNYLMCTLWLPEGPNRLPEASHHQIGVGGMCLNHDGTKILVIQEKTGCVSCLMFLSFRTCKSANATLSRT